MCGVIKNIKSSIGKETCAQWTDLQRESRGGVSRRVEMLHELSVGKQPDFIRKG